MIRYKWFLLGRRLASVERPFLTHYISRIYFPIHLGHVLKDHMILDVYSWWSCTCNYQNQTTAGQRRFEMPHDKNNKMTCAPSEDSDQTGFAREPLRSYFHEPQKNEITLWFYNFFVHYLWNFDLNLANKRRRKVIIRRLWLLRSTAVTMTWR